MRTVSLSAERMDELIGGFSHSRIAVLGDFFLDKYLDVDPDLAEPSVETGKTAHQVVRVRCSPGAAGTVVCNLAALGAGQLHAIGFTGDDGEGFELRKELARVGCHTEHLHVTPDRRTPTYLKPRDVNVPGLDAEHSRYDTQNRTVTSADTAQRITASLDELLADVDAVVVQDQVDQDNCGVVTGAVRRALSQCARGAGNVIFWTDSRRRIREFAGLIIKPNQFETIGREDPLPGDAIPLESLLEAARQLRADNGAPVVVTRGALGMLVSDPTWTLVPGVTIGQRVDPTGAGDSATAGAILALCAGATLPEAALLGNLVASITIEQIGTTGVARPNQLPERLRLWQRQQEEGDDANRGVI